METRERRTRINQSFGCASVTIDLELFDCVLVVTTPGLGDPHVRTVRLHSLGEIEGAYLAQRDRAIKGASNSAVANADVAKDCAAALKFAFQTLNAKQRKMMDRR